MELVIFSITAAIALIGGSGMLLARNAVHSALFLLLNFAAIAVLFLLLQSPFLAAIQVTVYAGAIMVLFLFVVMLLGAERVEDLPDRLPWQRTLAFGLAIVLMAEAIVISGGQALPSIASLLPGGAPTPAREAGHSPWRLDTPALAPGDDQGMQADEADWTVALPLIVRPGREPAAAEAQSRWRLGQPAIGQVAPPDEAASDEQTRVLVPLVKRPASPPAEAAAPAQKPAIMAPEAPTSIGVALFTTYLLPFEVTGVLLLVAIVGVVVLQQRTRIQKKSREK